ncbi:MAG: uroporphyrinogen-III C-methyltransferase [Sandaracinus sp.]|nr:uroporphyrinogen-III C-methyltransferase [Sandaracinus sp.]
MTGKLILIGCGPGAADLLTVRAVSRIREADLILYDRLVEPEVLDLAGRQAELVYVGKGCGDGGRQQADINTTLAEALGAGRLVARLKSGDPMVFGRAAEELTVAVELGADIEIVPGVTAALAAASECLITVTERQELQSFVLTTGKSAEKNKDPDWSNLVKPGVCVAFYMSVAQAWRIQTALMAKGVPGHLSADWIENVGKHECRWVSSRLSRLAHDARVHRVTNPAILLIRYPLSAAAQNQLSLEGMEAL